MNKKLCSLLLLSSFFSACASAPVAHRGHYKPKSFVTPIEYFSKTRPAVLTPEDKIKIDKVEYQAMSEETKEDKHQAILIGTLVGVAVIGGAVAGIMLAK